MALTLIKIRLLKDPGLMQGFLQRKPNATGEERHDYLQEEAMSDVLQQRADIVAKDDYKDLIAELKRHVLQLYKMVKEDNKHIWPGIENPNLPAQHSSHTFSNNQVLAMLSQFITFLALTGCAAAAPNPRAAKCTSYTIINTRGTGEIQGPSAGFRTMNSQITSQLPGGKIYNTVYLAGFDQNSAQGTQDIIREVNSVLASNPSECFILEGYSQGAAATVNALPQLTGSAGDAVKGVFLIGDPLHKSGLACNVDNNGGTTTKNVNGLEAFGGGGIPQNWISRTLDVCIFGDGVCDTTHGFGINAQHLQYPTDAATQELGTTFVVKQLSG
ncbi:cutinase 1 [Fusarium globosum]|uniref:Cutinase 1 n=1 Tax=Fusarium globosum TaxID=78864 RepID=A0A8H5YHR4_9HYPO|nr:cutinase 1 [Fusarium globosum]